MGAAKSKGAAAACPATPATKSCPTDLHYVGDVVRIRGGAMQLLPRIVAVWFAASMADSDVSFCMETLQDPRGWSRFGLRFIKVQRRDTAMVAIYMETPEQLAARFPGTDMHRWSVTKGDERPVPIYLNADNWQRGHTLSGHASLREYRQYALNHEMGHALGYSHKTCSGSGGGRACIMQQQTHGTQGCEPSSWPSERPECLDAVWEGVEQTLNRGWFHSERASGLSASANLWQETLRAVAQRRPHLDAAGVAALAEATLRLVLHQTRDDTCKNADARALATALFGHVAESC